VRDARQRLVTFTGLCAMYLISPYATLSSVISRACRLTASPFRRPLRPPTRHAVTSSAGRFTVQLPGTPVEMKDKMTLLTGGLADTHSYEIKGGWLGVSYFVQYMDFPVSDQAILGNVERALVEMRNRVVGKNKLVASQFTMLGDAPGIAFLYREADSPGVAQVRIYLSGKRVYQLFASPLNEAKLDLNATRFFDSFELKHEKPKQKQLKAAATSAQADETPVKPGETNTNR
jgi:hypothetical protein